MMTNKLDDCKSYKGLIKLCLVFFVVCIVIVGAISVYRGIDISKKESVAESQLNYSKTVEWLNYLLSKNYDLCDMVSYDRLDNPSWVDYMDSNKEIDNVLSGLVDCIENVSITNHSLNTFTVEVTFIPYKEVNELKLDKAYINDLGDRYANNDLYTSQLQSELNKIYDKAFTDTVFAKDINAEKVTISLTLSESEINGVTIVYGTKAFIETLLSDTNILSNLQFYEKNIKSTVEQYLVKDNEV